MNINYIAMLLGFIISSWVLILSAIIFTYLSFNPWGKKFFEPGSTDGVEPSISRAWKHRWTFMLCYSLFKTKTDRAGLREIGGDFRKLSKQKNYFLKLNSSFL